jgi:DNA phosphorothioation-associated putative methyltransferase
MTFWTMAVAMATIWRGWRLWGVACRGWDPAHRPDGERTPSHIVNVGSVVNVIENPEERTQVLRDSWALAQNMLIVSARLQHELRGEVLSPYGDGWLTKTGTFQKYYNPRELNL